tara:strand:+ start:304 stop:783 length:480 start_codon:yes stop_codon:yes gene_type:complete
MEENSEKGVQRKFAPNSICFGCGPANNKGLQIDSHEIENGLVTTFLPKNEHEAFPGVLNGGIIGTLLDCHGNWTAAIAIMKERGDKRPDCTVTARYSIKLKRPTPMNQNLKITSKIVNVTGDRAEIEMWLESEEGKICAQGEGLFVAVTEGHPAYHRWH